MDGIFDLSRVAADALYHLTLKAYDITSIAPDKNVHMMIPISPPVQPWYIKDYAMAKSASDATITDFVSYGTKTHLLA